MLKRNIIANFLGTGYGMLLQFIMVPITLHYLGPQAYGLIGVYATLVAILALLDLGLSPALGRELARLSVLPFGNSLMRRTVTTLETICLIAAISIGVLMWVGAPFLAKYWFTKSSLSVETITNCLQWMGLQSALQFLTGYYNSGIVGMQRIELSNGIAASTQTMRTFMLLWLLLTDPKIESYFIYQLASSLITLIATGYALYFILPKDQGSENKDLIQLSKTGLFKKIATRYSHERFIACRGFAGGMVLTTLSTLALTQLDKVILSKMLSLEEFGYYTIAASIAGMLSKPAGIVFGATLPRMTQLATSGDTGTLKSVYFKSSSLVSWLILPSAGVLIGFSMPLLTLYLQNANSASHIAPLTSVLAIGFTFHSLTYIPYGLTLAYGWSRFGVYFGVIGTLTLLPFIVLATNLYGALGAAYIWCLLCFSYVTIFMVVIHRKYLKGVLTEWYKQVVFLQGLTLITLISVSFFK